MSRTLALIFFGAALAAVPSLLAQGTGGQQPPPANPSAPSPQASPPPQQSAPPPAAEPEEGAPLNKLGLSDDQRKQIHSIRKQAESQVQTVRNDTSLTPQQQTQQIRQIRRKALQQIEDVLTPEQREQYDAWRKSHRHRRRQPPLQPQPAPNPGGI